MCYQFLALKPVSDVSFQKLPLKFTGKLFKGKLRRYSNKPAVYDPRNIPGRALEI